MKNKFFRVFFFVFFILFVSSKNIYADETYSLKMKDNLIVSQVSTKINKLIDEKWNSVTIKYVVALDKTLKKLDEKTRAYQIINEIKKKIVSHTNEINIKEQKNEEDTLKNEVFDLKYTPTTDFKEFKIDIGEVRNYRLTLNNTERNSLWRENYKYSEKLIDSAQEWSDFSLSKWELTHKRNSSDSYYDYWKINSRFADREIVCKNVNWITHTESIWRWYYKCSDDNCTEKLKNSLNDVFSMYLKEKNQSSRPHYDWIVRSEFQNIWVWIAIKQKSDNNFEFYITTHMCTELK